MKIAIFSFGSRGDIEPYVALAVGLQRAGHAVKLVAPQAYADWIGSHGVGFHPLRFDLAKFIKADAMAGLRAVLRNFRRIRDGIRQGSFDALDDYLAAAQDADFVIQTGAANGAVEIAERLGIPMAFAFPYPYKPTRAFPSFFFPSSRSLGGAYNYLTHRLVLRSMWPTYGPPLNRWRAERFALPPWRSYLAMLDSRRALQAPSLHAYSPSVLPKPLDWDAAHHVTGYWLVEPARDWQPPAELQRFLDDGPPPVFVGFGSMKSVDPVRLTRAVLEALAACGQRGVLLAGGGGSLTRLPAPDSICYVEHVPYTWLFPRMAAVVHHGGAGTNAAVLRAGVPSATCPMGIDQLAWADLNVKLGIGVRAPSITRINARKLTRAIRAVSCDAAMRERAATLGARIRAEDGVANAVAIIEAYAAQFATLRATPLPASQHAIEA